MKATDLMSGPMTPGQNMLAALNRTKREGEMYGGTVPPAEKARRRAKNKVARAQRATNRKRNA